ncbi:MAG: HAD family hydrolase [Solirubrobacteraceae bacterium]
MPMPRLASIKRTDLTPGTIARIAFSPRHLTPAISGRASDDEWRSGIAGELATAIGETDARDAVAAWSADIGTVDASVLDLLRQVRWRCPVIILSNATTRLRQDLSSLGLDGEVDAVVSSAETGSPKPQPAAFCRHRRDHRAAARLSTTSARGSVRR